MEQKIAKYFWGIEYLICCPVADMSNGGERVVGSAVMVLPGIFITAKHVAQEWHDYSTDTRGHDISLLAHEQTGDFKVKIWHMLKDGRVAEWHADQIVSMPDYDVAFLIDHGNYNDVAAELIKEEVYPRIRFDLHAPRVGDHLMAVGYPKTLTRKTREGHQHLVTPFSNKGVVEEIYYEGAGLIKGPTFQTDIKVEGGMSGCPVFNDDSLICGIVSSAYDPTDDYPKYTTFISSLWYAFAAKLPANLTPYKNVTLLELADMDYLTIIGREHIKEEDGEIYWQEVVADCQECIQRNSLVQIDTKNTLT